MELEKPISVHYVKSLFNNFKVTHTIASGDSPDFHMISVINKKDETLFYTMSYLIDGVKESDEEYNIDLLIINSSEIQDEYGVRVGDRVSDVLRKRKDKLSVIGGHFNNSIGANSIFYQITVPPTKEEIEKGLDFLHPDYVTVEMILNTDPKVESMSWPLASWD